ncbi:MULTISPECIES: hypothetical protein [Streptomyces]|uniref:Secreted protein n=2 Tax=Streptomyces TaxID=1883 RepID=A0ABS9JV95_9ACTN|nr:MULTISPECIES: hypothetical protein [Streptomyces]MCG0069478.1 hypothetical protein [Streptomyces tricolor]BCM66956.1 hypothetical protein EASAB2608_02290 [Streptomyces sp. EAS-AB2608]CUW28527.1 hypothetical protein TUE45_03266 [Streptomyces reticuli]
MKAQRVRRLFAVTAAGVLLAGGAAIGTAGTASAATPDRVSTNHGCYDRGGWWGGCGHYDRGNFYNTGFFPGFVPGGGVVVVVVN